MSVTAPAENIEHPGLTEKFRNMAIGALFAFVLLLSKAFRLRRNPASWLLFRLALGISGAALVVVPLSLGNNLVTAVGGLVMFAAAVLLPPPKTESGTDRKARELGALVVINGGLYRQGNAPAVHVQLFVGAEHIRALDSHFQPLLVIPTTEISLASVEENGRKWVLRIRWAEHSTEFAYHGIFAEHLARVAEATIRSVMSQRLPVLPRRRAASA